MKALITIGFIFFIKVSMAQSIEVMPGTENMFFDIQFLKPLQEDNYKFTVFSRTRGIVDYESNANILSAAYVSYSSKMGLGLSVIGAVNSGSGPSTAGGINILKAKKDFSIFALMAIEFEDPLGYSFFTIMRYTPLLRGDWKLYSSLELFTLFRKSGHEVSSERIRLGLDFKGLQFGLGTNLTQFTNEFISAENYGVFVRKSF
ncbi:MAG: hypothetical protein MRY83_04275 [Flavobacteriales bacterium]|nr:hypothetical protein [Flavobacteriales bacterium]